MIERLTLGKEDLEIYSNGKKIPGEVSVIFRCEKEEKVKDKGECWEKVKEISRKP